MSDANALYQFLRSFRPSYVNDAIGDKPTIAKEFANVLGYDSSEVLEDTDGFIIDYWFSLNEDADPWIALQFLTLGNRRSYHWEFETSLETNGQKIIALGHDVIAISKGQRFTFYGLAELTLEQSQEIFQIVSRAEQPPPLIFKRECLQTLIKAVESAKTTKEKGDAMEELAQFVIDDIPAVTVEYTNLRTRSSEIDIVAKYDPSESSIPIFGTDRYILVECKNWHKPVTSSVVRDVFGKMENTNCRTGILFSKTGITGRAKYREAEREIHTKFVRSGSALLVVSLDDVKKVNSGKDLVRVLEERFAELTLDFSKPGTVGS
ncbi:hypothetical protein EYC79_04760 [Agrobacterium cavarae]|uniref:Restriction endonuclease type IV Mrr domain-containing protein n=1 Tax=Agrobacterium cavarae TaxID=2528239 RepID=A0ABY1YDN4_9HYPH|nr:restriction endonuclease [Agrobacterium cavarae]TBN17117.1 hypothetical protein EYC79_04760 [Agrobacterium cavarae]